jgi:hypothetical protein
LNGKVIVPAKVIVESENEETGENEENEKWSLIFVIRNS